ncbi:MAG: type II secretion system protein M [Enterovibrio sp.]
MENILTFWRARSQQEQRGMMVGAVVLIVCIFYFGLISPLYSRANLARSNLAIEQELNSFVADKAEQIKMLKRTSNSTVNKNVPINQAVTETSSRYKIEIDKLQSNKEDLDVQLKPTSFTRLLQWLDELEKKYAIHPKLIELNKTNVSGMVEVRKLQLSRE